MKARARLAALIVVLVGLAGVVAGSVYALTIETQARGTFALKHDQVELARGVARLIGEPTDAAVQKIVLGVGEGPGWHTHPGPAVVIVKTGNFTMVQNDCSEVAFEAGDVVVDQGFGNIHRAYNPGPGTTEVWVSYIVPQAAGLVIPSSAPDCAA
jgi:quercetin dioxygenase-like cupin family protein